MKILYITSLSMNIDSGAQKHVMGIFNELKKMDVDIQLLSPSVFKSGIYGAIERKFNLAKSTKEAINNLSPDIVYFRYEGADAFSAKEVICQRIPYVIELNTKTVPEFWATRRFLPYCVSVLTEPWVFSNASGVAAVTSEIYKYAVKSGKKENPFLLAKNGIDIKSYVYYKYNPSIRELYNTPIDAPLLAMIGSISPWHGADILLRALSSAELEKFYLWIVGNIDIYKLRKNFPTQKIFERVKFIPWQNPSNLTKILSAVDVGIGSLSLQRQQMQEAQPLKVRAYLASGLPTLLGYIDSVISSELPFISSGRSSSIEALSLEIRRFYEHVTQNQHELRKQARDYAEKYLSWSIAAKETLDFLKDILWKK